MMLTSEKLAQVADAAEQIQTAAEKVRNLLADERRGQPPSERYIGLRVLLRQLELNRRSLLELWS